MVLRVARLLWRADRGFRVLGAALLALPAGCAISGTDPAPAGPPAVGLRGPGSDAPTAVHLYFYSAQGLERVSRLYRGPDAPGTALRRLADGPDAAERARGLVSYAPDSTPVVTARGPGVLEVFAPVGWESRSAQRQLVCTAADAASTADGTDLGAVRVKVRRAEDGGAVTRRCTP